MKPLHEIMVEMENLTGPSDQEIAYGMADDLLIEVLWYFAHKSTNKLEVSQLTSIINSYSYVEKWYA